MKTETVAGAPKPEHHLHIDETGDDQARQMEEQRARYAMYWELRNREQTRDITLETLSRTGLIRTINELENQVMTERANGEYWERAGREARAHSLGVALKIDELRVVQVKLGAAERQVEIVTEAHEMTASRLSDVIKERDEARAKIVDLERTLSIVRGDLATATRARLNAEGNLYAELDRGIEHNQSLQAGLTAANSRASRAERKAAKANTELDAMLKHLKALGTVVKRRETVLPDCQCDMCSNARAALDYLKQPKG